MPTQYPYTNTSDDFQIVVRGGTRLAKLQPGGKTLLLEGDVVENATTGARVGASQSYRRQRFLIGPPAPPSDEAERRKNILRDLRGEGQRKLDAERYRDPRVRPFPTVPPRPQLPQPGRERTKATGPSGPRAGVMYKGAFEPEQPFVAPPGSGAGGSPKLPDPLTQIQISRAVAAVTRAIPEVKPGTVRFGLKIPLKRPPAPPSRPLPTIPLKVPMTGPSTPPIGPESFAAPRGATVPAKVLPPSRSGYDADFDWYDAVDGQYSPGPAPFRLPGAVTSGSRRGPEPYRLKRTIGVVTPGGETVRTESPSLHPGQVWDPDRRQWVWPGETFREQQARAGWRESRPGTVEHFEAVDPFESYMGRQEMIARGWRWNEALGWWERLPIAARQ